MKDWGVLKRIIGLARPYQRWGIFIVLLAVVLAPLRTAAPYIINQLVDGFVKVEETSFFIRWILLYVLFLLVQLAGEYVFVYYSEKLGQQVVFDLRKYLFKRLLSFKMRYFDVTPIGKNTTRVVSDIETLGLVFTRQGLTMMVADVLSVIAVLTVMIITSWKLTFICLLTMPLMLIATYIFKEKVKEAFTQVRQLISEMNAFVQERISGMKTVQLCNVEEREAHQFSRMNTSYKTANIRTIKYYAVFFPVVEIISSLALALMIWWGAGDVVKDRLTLGVLVAFPMYVNRLFRPIRFLADKFNNVQMAMVAAGRVFDLMDEEDNIEHSGNKTIKSFEGHVCFEHLWFSYDGEQQVLKDVSFDIPAGTTAAFVGATGSGKTSVSNVICKLYDYQKGSATIDGYEIRELKNRDLRSKIGIVLQDVFLFAGTILDNIRLRDERITLEQVIDAAKMIGAHEMILGFEGGYHHFLYERGANLSVGQRQLIAFVRVLVFDPKLLILDEATSSIDTMSERVIQKAIDIVTQDRTTIIIAHRLATIRNAHQVLVLDGGKVIEQGAYDELLLKDNGAFRNLYEMQFSADELLS